MEKDLERKQTDATTFGYDKGFVATKEQIKRADVPVKAPDTVVVNPLKFVEDAVEQNDNNFDGIINNVPEVPNNEMASANPTEKREEKKSVIEQLQNEEANVRDRTHLRREEGCQRCCEKELC